MFLTWNSQIIKQKSNFLTDLNHLFVWKIGNVINDAQAVAVAISEELLPQNITGPWYRRLNNIGMPLFPTVIDIQDLRKGLIDLVLYYIFFRSKFRRKWIIDNSSW